MVVGTFRLRLALSLLTSGLAGCAARSPALSPSATPDLTTVIVTGSRNLREPVNLRNQATVGQRAVTASLSEVWAVLPAVFAQLGIETTRIDSSEGIIGNPAYRARRIEGQRMSEYLDCGRSFGSNYADQYAVTLGILVQLASSPDGRTLVRTVVDAYARDPSQNGNAVHCITWGSLERRIGDLVAERLET